MNCTDKFDLVGAEKVVVTERTKILYKTRNMMQKIKNEHNTNIHFKFPPSEANGWIHILKLSQPSSVYTHMGA